MGVDCIFELTLEQKALLTSGDGSWHTAEVGNLPSVMMTDGPHGLRKEIVGADGINDSFPATCFPTACAVASSWNVRNAEKIACGIADEAIAEGVSVVLGPGINIKRSPLCGRNFEYFSEDPFLAGHMGASYIRAMQQKGVGCCVKHFAVNSQETRRMTVDAIVDERALREIYLAAFEHAIKDSKPWAVMASYNKVNGTSATQSKYLLTDILRNEWKFDGLVMSDWGASYNTAKAIEAGMDLEMPEDRYGYHRQTVINAVKSGEMKEGFLDIACARVGKFVERCLCEKSGERNFEKNHAVCREVAADSAVLLKNDGLLPLADTDFCVIGELAEKPRFQGAGSSHINAKCKNFLQVLLENGISVPYAKGYSVEKDKADKKAESAAVALAKTHRTVLFFGGLTDIYEGEGYDRTLLDIPQNQQSLLDKLYQENSNIVFVAFGGSPFVMPWLNKVKSLLNMYLGGQAVMEAAFDLLFGKVSPSGRLAETFPLQLCDTPCYNYFANDRHFDEHRESIFVGYRYYSTFDIPVLFPFGYGLSYSEFAYSDLKISRSENTFDVTVTVKNIGQVAASEVVQLYVDNPMGFRAKRELRGFSKVYLGTGESVTVQFALDERAFSVYEVGSGFVAVNGTYGISVGKNVNEMLLSKNILVDFGIDWQSPSLEGYFSGFSPVVVFDEKFFSLLGRQMPKIPTTKRGQYTLLNTFEDMTCNVKLMRILKKLLRRIAVKRSGSKSFNSPVAKMIYYGAMQTPLIAMMSVGGIHPKYVKFFLHHANKQRGKALRALLGKYTID